jgi:hypothetical protein
MRLIIVWVLLGSSVAHAQRAPDLATLDRGDGISKIGIDLGFSSLEPPPYTGALRFELYGQYVSRMGLGFYGALPLSRSFGGEGMPMPPEANNATSLSNLDLGFLFVTSGTELSWVFRLGVALPTSTSGIDEALTRYYATGPRLTDLVLATNDWHVRLAVSPLLHIDRLFLRADLGFDLNGGGDYYHFLRFNVGGGIDLGAVALSLELVNTAAFGDFVGDEEDFFHSLALTARFMLERFQPFISVGLPIDEYRRDAIRFFVSGGLVIEF